MKTHASILIAALSTFGLAASVQANVVNGDFSAGSTSWTSFGDVLFTGGNVTLTNASSAFEDDFPAVAGAFNISGTAAGDANTANGLEEFSGLTIGDLDISAGNTAFEGSAFKQTVAVNAGDTLTFDYVFLTNEGVNLDYAYFAINGTRFSFATVANATVPTSPYAFSTGPLNRAHVIGTTGTVTLAFGVTDIGGFDVTSAVTIDNINITPVPEPSAYAALAGFATLGFVALRRRRAA